MSEYKKINPDSVFLLEELFIKATDLKLQSFILLLLGEAEANFTLNEIKLKHMCNICIRFINNAEQNQNGQLSNEDYEIIEKINSTMIFATLCSILNSVKDNLSTNYPS